MDLRHATRIIKPNYWLSKVDLKSAYRSVKCRQLDHQLTGLQWTFKGKKTPTYMVDAKLPFGHKRSPMNFQRITSAVCYLMKQLYGVTCIVYLDDFLIVEKTYQACNNALLLLLH